MPNSSTPAADAAAPPAGFVVRRLTPADLGAVVELHAQAHRSMPRPGLLARESVDFFDAHLGDAAGGGLALGVERAGRLVAYGILGLPAADDPYHFGHELHWPAARLERCSLCDGAVVAAEARGRGLHALLIAHRLRLSEAAGRAESLATAAPGNPASWRHLLRQGFVVRRVIERFGGPRYLLHRPAGSRIDVDRSGAVAAGAAPGQADLLRQAALLRQGCVGVADADPASATLWLVREVAAGGC